jgi:hypothetical protein
MENSYALESRGASITARKQGPTSVEVVARPNPGVAEKPYQCANRTGIFEALSQWFTAELALIDHPECFHRGDPRCRYIVTWQESGSHRWRRIRNMMIALATMACAGAMVFLPFSAGNSRAGVASLVFACGWQSEGLSRWLTDTVANQKKAAEETLLESEVRYNNALLVQEIGQATSTILDIDNLIAAVMGIIEKRLDFDRGMLMLTNAERTSLQYAAGYGHSPAQEDILRTTAFNLSNPQSKGVFILAMRERRPAVENIHQIESDLSPKTSSLHVAGKPVADLCTDCSQGGGSRHSGR